MAEPLASILDADVYGLLLVDDVCSKKASDAPPARRAELPSADALTDEEALARVLASEVGSHSLQERLAVAWAVRNNARNGHMTIARLVCSPMCGREGERIGTGKAVRQFSSAQEPNERDRELARKVLAMPQSKDPTNGATHFFEPALLDRQYAAGNPRVRFNSEKLRERWAGRGERQVATVGRIELWV
jgi:spore germination cell wall hydrolase CwlJ-like protein